MRAWCGGLLLLALAGCSLYPPTDGVPHAGPRGLDGVAAGFHVQPLDPGSAVPLITQVVRELAKTDPDGTLKGTTYRLTQGNRLDPDWLIQTPDVWGMRADAVRFVPLDCAQCDADFHLPVCRRPRDCDSPDCAPLHATISRPGMRPPDVPRAGRQTAGPVL